MWTVDRLHGSIIMVSRGVITYPTSLSAIQKTYLQKLFWIPDFSDIKSCRAMWFYVSDVSDTTFWISFRMLPEKLFGFVMTLRRNKMLRVLFCFVLFFCFFWHTVHLSTSQKLSWIYTFRMSPTKYGFIRVDSIYK